MESVERLKHIIEQQRQIADALEIERRTFESSDLAKENAALKAGAEKLRAELNKASAEAAALAAENSGLKNALAEQMYSERTKLLEAATRKLDIYFESQTQGELNRLTALERQVRARADGLRENLSRHRVNAEDELFKQLDAITALADKCVTEARAQVAASSPLTGEERAAIEDMRTEPLTDTQVRAAAKKNNMERLVGLNLLNVAGVFLLLIGAITLARFTYSRLDDTVKGIMLFGLGGVMLAAGEFLNRKSAPTVFSLGISAGGVAILYAALATSYFGLGILSMFPAVAICVLITAVAFALSSRYRSQTIAAFALVGGYLPMFSVSESAVVAYGAMVYFITLNLLALLLSFREKWRFSSFLGLSLNILGTGYICFVFADATDPLSKTLTILYVLFAFLIYTAIPLVSSYRARVQVSKSDIVLLGINTFFSSIMMYGVFTIFDLEDYHGLLAVVFAVLYLFLGRFIEKKFSGDDRHTRALFYLTGLAFAILVVPFQFGRMWLSLGWLAEGVLLAVYGILREEKRFRQAGLVICCLCLFAFVVFDVLLINDGLFAWKYLAITVGSMAILGAHMRAGTMAGSFASGYKYFALVNLWLYSQYLLLAELLPILNRYYGEGNSYSLDYLIGAAMVTVTFALAYAFPRIPLLRTSGVRILSVVLHIIGILGLALLNINASPVARAYFRADSPALGVTIVGTVILALLGIISLLALFEVTRTLTAEQRLAAQYVPLIVSGYFVVVLTQNLILQYGLAFSSAVLSVIYVLTALAWIVLGFIWRYSLLRKFGLCLSILAVVKLFIIDLYTLTQGYRIVTYFVLGVTLITISFVYQRFIKRLELREGVIADGQKNN